MDKITHENPLAHKESRAMVLYICMKVVFIKYTRKNSIQNSF